VAYQNLAIIRRNFTHLTPDCFILLNKCLVRSHVEYANSVWNTQYIENHKKIEKVQMRATKLIHELKGWLDYGYGTVEKLSAADRRINMSLMKISYSHGARN